ncbi:WhiB family transcriptional regulator [Kineococcus radiotolerans]|uniref:WhiB family transcriptional regulator n=1 Tax=Kineococcus radiotolerans TaxID=131568 RepID=UPI00288C0F55|nr:WhiB family transcriptional regulator [Kineococcus radiotolerans]
MRIRTCSSTTTWSGDLPAATAKPQLCGCAECPVLRLCRQYALAQREVDGVWGGLTQEQQHQMWAATVTRASKS